MRRRAKSRIWEAVAGSMSIGLKVIRPFQKFLYTENTGSKYHEYKPLRKTASKRI
jgi:hypothetical protein